MNEGNARKDVAGTMTGSHNDARGQKTPVETLSLIPAWPKLLALLISLTCHLFPIITVLAIVQSRNVIIGNVTAMVISGGLACLVMYLSLTPITPERKKRASLLLALALGVTVLAGVVMTVTGMLSDDLVQLAFYLQFMPSLAGWGTAAFMMVNYRMEWDVSSKKLALVTDTFITVRREEVLLDSSTVVTVSSTNVALTLEFISFSSTDDMNPMKTSETTTWSMMPFTDLTKVFYTVLRWSQEAGVTVRLRGKLLTGKLREKFMISRPLMLTTLTALILALPRRM